MPRKRSSPWKWSLPDHPLGDGVGVRRAHRSQNRLDPDPSSACDEVPAIATVAVSDEEPWLLTPGDRLDHLPPDPGRDHGYYATLFHELAHSTGHPGRLAREGYRTAARFGSERYSQEELVAEFAAAFLGSEAGIDPSRVEQSAAYIASWLRVLDDDRHLVVVAAAQGQRAADHILGRRPEAPEEPPEAAA